MPDQDAGILTVCRKSIRPRRYSPLPFDNNTYGKTLEKLLITVMMETLFTVIDRRLHAEMDHHHPFG